MLEANMLFLANSVLIAEQDSMLCENARMDDQLGITEFD